MAQLYQVPQHSFWLLMLATLMATVPHMLRGPFWLAGAILLLLTWRIQVQKGHMRMPGKLTRSVVLFLGIAGTIYSYGTLLGPQAGVCLLVFAFALKTLEMFRQRDAFVVIVLAYFVLATAFLFDRDMLASAYILVVMVFVSAALVGINQEDHQAKAVQHLRIGGVMVLQAIPLMLILFVLVPRIGPLWVLDMAKGEARTGMGDSMAPGEISNLSMSDELAFRVEFDGAVPPPAKRYWRGLTLSEFDGRRWEQFTPENLHQEHLYFPGKSVPYWVQDLNQVRRNRQPDYQYRVIMEPAQRNWLFALTTPFVQNREIALARDHRLLVVDRLDTRLAYEVDSYTNLQRDRELPEWLYRLNLSYPPGSNPRAEALARRWYRQSGSPRAYAEKVLNWFRNEAFYYTLKPPLAGESPIDSFLFDSRKGFCEHYASAFTFMMRVAGVPARVVLGYQGGEVNPIGSHMMVYQYDAHAWSEIWVQGQGWIELDPTGAVAPERIELGLEDAMREEGSFLEDDPLSLSRYRDNPLLARLRHSLDYMQLAWQKWVLGYDSNAQNTFLKQLLGEVTPMRIAIALATAGFSFVLVLLLWMLLRQGRRLRLPPLQREYWKMYRLLERKGYQLDLHGQPGVRTLEQRVRQQGGESDALAQWVRQYEAELYGRSEPLASLTAIRKLRRKVAALPKRQL